MMKNYDFNRTYLELSNNYSHYLNNFLSLFKSHDRFKISADDFKIIKKRIDLEIDKDNGLFLENHGTYSTRDYEDLKICCELNQFIIDFKLESLEFYTNDNVFRNSLIKLKKIFGWKNIFIH